MKPADEVMPVLKKLYQERLGRSPDEIVHVGIKELDYLVATEDKSVRIMRRPIDLHIDNEGRDSRAEAEIVAKLKGLL